MNISRKKLLIGSGLTLLIASIVAVVIVLLTRKTPSITDLPSPTISVKPEGIPSVGEDEEITPDDVDEVITDLQAQEGAESTKEITQPPIVKYTGDIKSLFGEAGCTVIQGNDNSMTLNCNGTAATIYGAVGPPGLNGRDGVCSAETVKQAAKDSVLSVKGLEVTGEDGIMSKGNIKTEGNLTTNGLTQTGSLNVVRDSKLNGKLNVGSDSTIGGILNVVKDSKLNGTLNVGRDSTIGGILKVNGSGISSVAGDMELKKNLTFGTRNSDPVIKYGNYEFLRYARNIRGGPMIQLKQPVEIGWNDDNRTQLWVANSDVYFKRAKIGDLSIRNDVIERGDQGQIHFASDGKIHAKVGGAGRRGDSKFNVTMASGGYGSVVELGDNILLRNHPHYKGYLSDALRGNVRDKLPFIYNGSTDANNHTGAAHNLADFSEKTQWDEFQNQDYLISRNMNWADNNIDAIMIPPRTRVYFWDNNDFKGDTRTFQNDSYTQWKSYKLDWFKNKPSSVKIQRM